MDSRHAERHKWACFATQQAAKKAVKALHLHAGQKVRGAIIAQPFEELPETIDVPELLVEKGRLLDNFYVPSRPPNGHPTGAPFEHYGPLQSCEYAQNRVETLTNEDTSPILENSL